ncbi:MAG: AarF/ABC1/UbiB kinase family protein [Phycisphaerae bacterium]|nr:AarF/ABC1/UbiB kinase family protein [Gemmatimonadaceae bacterium]
MSADANESGWTRARESARDGARVVVIVARIAPMLISFRRDFRRYLKWGGPVPRTPAFHQRRADRVVHSIASLGPAFVKLAQIFATRADLVPQPYLGALGTLVDRVPTVAWPEIRSVIEKSWGMDPDTVVQNLDSTPLAAGSLGQVHRATYQGRNVVVKVLRPNVEEVVIRDVRIARRMVDWMYRHFPHHHVLGFRVVLDEFGVHVREEMNFVREGDQCTRMRKRFADEPRLRIPMVETALTRREVLVMEYLEGTRVDALDEQIAAGLVSPNALVETLIEIYARMMLRDGVFHADPHPGNLLVTKEGVLVLLDFGMVIEVPVETRKGLFDAIVAAVRRDVEGTTDSFYALGLVAPGTDRSVMLELVEVLMNIAYSETAMNERARAVADRVMHELFEWPVVLPGELVYFARTAALIEGIGGRYDRNFNSIRVASPVVIRLRKELLAVLTGQDAKTANPVVGWAAMLGALAGGAVGYLRSKTEQR